MLNTRQFILAFSFVLLISAVNIAAQGTAFVYQGKLQDGGAAANGVYQFEFRLFDAAGGGNQIGQTLSGVEATVANGIFAVTLDFGAASYPGAARFLEIAVRPNGGPSYTNLNPRQEIASTPYAVRSLNANQATQSDTANFATDAANLGGIAADQYVLTTDPRLNQTPGNYIQNSTSPQPTSNFNISGEGKADKLTAATQFNIGPNRILATSNANLFVGFGTGQSNPINGLNTFVGNNAGMSTTSGTRNTLVGAGAGIQNTTGSDNSFFGSGAGIANTTGAGNAFFGAFAGNSNTTSAGNSFFGFESGKTNNAGSDNSFFGAYAGKANLGGIKNSFFGRSAGAANTDGDFNSFFGNSAGLNNTTGIGNSFFGDSTGLLNGSGSNNSFFGKGAGLVSTTGSSNVFLGYSAGINNTSGSNNTLLGANTQVASNNLQFATAIGAGATVENSNLIVLGRNQGQDGVFIWGKTAAIGGLTLGTMVPGANNPLCGGGGSGTEIGFCSSSIRYKENVADFTGGLEIVKRLRPVSYAWKSSGERDLGFIAEEINAIEPLLNVYHKGRIEGVKYGQMTTILVNAVKEQQAQLDAQAAENQKLKEQLDRQQTELEALKAAVCAPNPAAAVCRPK